MKDYASQYSDIREIFPIIIRMPRLLEEPRSIFPSYITLANVNVCFIEQDGEHDRQKEIQIPPLLERAATVAITILSP